MMIRRGPAEGNCQIFRHFVKGINSSLCFVICALAPLAAQAGFRDIASFVSQDEVIVVPRSEESWYEANLIDDDNGIMNSMRVDIRRWQEQENYLRLWGLQNTGIFSEVSLEEKQKRVSRDMLRYADKRLAGEVKKADKNSNLYKVGQAQRTLSPSSTVSFWEGYAIKFQVRALQGKGTVVFRNPYVNSYFDITAGGRREFVIERWFSLLPFRTAVNFRFDSNLYFTSFDYRITENVSTSLISQQGLSDAAFSGASDKRLQLNFFKSF